MPVKVTIALPSKLLNRYRPLELKTYQIVVQIPILGQKVSVNFEAMLYECPKKHYTYIYQHTDEERRAIIACSKCGADAQGLTIKYRWEYHADYTECRGCGSGFDFKAGKPRCKKDCPYERIGHNQY